MDEFDFSKPELEMRQQILQKFRAQDQSGVNKLHASTFQGILTSMGLGFGSGVVDRIMLQCKIDDQGFVR